MAKVKYTTPGGTVKGLYHHMLKQTHLLIGGTTGSGKSVLINGLITTGLHYLPTDEPNGVQFIFIDPKRVELLPYKKVPHCIGYASEPEEMVGMLRSAMDLIDKRYRKMAKRGLLQYDGSKVYVIIDELADLMTTNRRAVQPLIQRISQVGRAAGVILITATQCPLVKVIPTEIKVNYNGIVALRTRNAQDSRNIIGQTGAELLPMYGECLYYSPEFGRVFQYSVPYVTPEEKMLLIRYWEKQVPLLKRLFGKRR